MAERVFPGDFNDYCAFITSDGQIEGSEEILAWAQETNGTEGHEFDKSFPLFSNAVGAKAVLSGRTHIAVPAFGLALNQEIANSPIDPETQEISYTPNATVYANNYLDALVNHVTSVNEREQDPQKRLATGIWFESQLPDLRRAIIVTDLAGDIIAAQDARNAAIAAFVLMAPAREAIKAQQRTIDQLSGWLRGGARI